MGIPGSRTSAVPLPRRAAPKLGATDAAAHQTPADRQPAMSAAACIPLTPPVTITEREQRPDRFAELLESIADLLVETRRQQALIAPNCDSNDPRVREAIARLAEVARSLKEVAVEAASVHQQLQHVHLI
jgi:hypothetical protein